MLVEAKRQRAYPIGLQSSHYKVFNAAFLSDLFFFRVSWILSLMTEFKAPVDSGLSFPPITIK